jgi:para-aminobenzoate synthetase/4-amino-4-deoxychorismate lyase
LIKTNEVLLKNNASWRHYSNPHQVVSTNEIIHVRELLQDVEELVNQNGWHAAGFVSYEAAPAFDKALQVLASDSFPLAWFGLYPEPQVVDLPTLRNPFPDLNWKPTTERESYNTAIEKIKKHIADGKTYQANYTMRLKADFAEDEWNFFLQLAQTQNKHAAFVNTGRYVICSASPELFFELNGNVISSRPMKGTVKRGRTTAEDKAQANWLYNSIKNRAENVMIVDMIRNDLGRIAEIGSVQVPELFKIEKYPTLFQMTSHVQARTRASVTEIFGALFPCASITGAPKVSTMKIISELETTPRKIYTGSIGHISPNRNAQFNVAIRTAILDKDNESAEYGVGGGIVWDSASNSEYDEAMLKARVLTERQQEFSLLETILWTPKNGYFLLDKHLARLADSAEYFGFPFSATDLTNMLAELQAGFSTPQRIRVLSDRFGKLKIETKDFIHRDKVFKAKLAHKPIDSSNPFYFHKTTNRGIYPPVDDGDDVLLFNEKDELTEFTIGNLVVEMNGEYFTPPVSCGLLAGTFRAHLLETRQVKEQIIYKDQLKTSGRKFLINSLRKWVEVKI